MSLNFNTLSLDNQKAIRRKKICQGRSKIVYKGPESSTLVFSHQDHFEKNVIIQGRGSINSRFSELLMIRLGEMGIPNHFIKRLNMREYLVRKAEPLPFRVVVHNAASGNFAKRLGLEEGTILSEPVIEFELKPTYEGSPLINSSHIFSFGWACEDELAALSASVQRINDFLCGQFLAIGIRLMSYPLEFGRIFLSDFSEESEILLIDEVSPDTCQLFDLKNDTLLGVGPNSPFYGVPSKFYQHVAERFGILDEGGPPDLVRL